MNDPTQPTVFSIVESPVGPLTLAATEAGLQHLLFGLHRPDEGVEAPDHPILKEAAQQLDEYFAGARTTFDVPLDVTGTPFQRAVWTRLQTIPYGETTTYGHLAREMGSLGKARAVGLANGKNPVSIIVPCHRVIGASGALTGFGGGLDVKRFLLRLEQRHRPPQRAGQTELFAGA